MAQAGVGGVAQGNEHDDTLIRIELEQLGGGFFTLGDVRPVDRAGRHALGFQCEHERHRRQGAVDVDHMAVTHVRIGPQTTDHGDNGREVVIETGHAHGQARRLSLIHI